MSPKMLVLAGLTTVVMASAGGCDGLPSGVPSSLPTQIPTALPALPSDLPTELPELPQLPSELPDADGPTEAPPAGETVEAAPAPSAEPGVEASAAPGLVDDVSQAAGEVPWWVWALVALLLVGLVAAVVALRRARAEELRWAALWHELTGEARWLDERVVPAVQDRALDLSTLATRWRDGSRRFDDLDRRVWAAAGEQTRPARTGDLNALSEVLLRLRDALDTEVSLRTSGVEQPGLPDAAQTVADARDELRRAVAERTR